MGNSKFRFPSFSQLFRHLFLGWLFAALVEYLLVPEGINGLEELSCIASMSLTRLLIITLLVTAALTFLDLRFHIAVYERYAIPGIFLLLMAASLANSFTVAFLIICMAVLLVLTVYAILGHQEADPMPKAAKKSHWAFPTALAVISVAFFALLSVWTVCRYLTFSTPNFDFGIFSQMFHNMRTSGLPMTTVEREGLLSHFAVHVSPIYYLMLPFYCLFPDPATLQILQAAVICSAVIPLWLLGKHHGLSGLQRLLLCVLLLLLPATGGGVSYDLHENCFLLPLILWLMYAMDKRKTVLTAVFAFLTLMVKEDAAVYVAIAALYLIIRTAIGYKRERRKDLITGFAVLLGAVVWFLLVTNYLATQGDGVMTYRYKNFMFNGSDSLFSVIVAVLLCPMKMLFECVDPEKHTYIIQTLLPLLGLPLLTRKYERYLLLIPYILLNLMSDYTYQHDVFFQYNFGSTAFLIYLTTVNLSDLMDCLAAIKLSDRYVKWVQLIPLTAALLCGMFFCSKTVLPRANQYYQQFTQHQAYYDEIRENLDLVPENASVTSGTFYVAYLSERSVLYDVKYCSLEQILSTDYVVLNRNSKTDFKDRSYEKLSSILENAGYKIINDHSSIVIYQKTNALPQPS